MKKDSVVVDGSSVTLDGDSADRLRSVARRWGVSPDEAMRRVIANGDKTMSDRNQRRRLRRMRASLEGERDDLRRRIKDVDQRKEVLKDETNADIERYVDSLAKAVDADDQNDIPDDPEFYRSIAYWGWRGVQTPEQAKEELLKEVARRSVGKTDVALLLSSIDHTALTMHDTMPDRLKPLRGKQLIDEAVKTLTMEDFGATLVRDERWAVMRTRWIRLGWRGATTEESFNVAYIRAVCERMADVQEMWFTGRGVILPDCVLDEQLDAVPKPQREAMINAFAERLKTEHEALPKESDRRYGEVLNEPRGKAEVDLFGAIKVGVGGAEARQASPLTLGPKEPYSDHAMMRAGRIGWEQTYATGMTDEQVWNVVAGTHADETQDVLAMFEIKWAVHAFQRLMTSHTFAAALMCTDLQRDVLEGIEKQWDAFMVMVPNGMLVADELEFSRILVARYSTFAHVILLTVLPSGQMQLAVAQAASLPELLESDGSDLEDLAPSHASDRTLPISMKLRRCLVMAKRLVAGLLLNLQHPPNFTVRKVAAKTKGLRREAEPEHRIVSIGHPIEVDCRESIKRYIEHGKAGRKHGPPTVQVMVRGHWRRQVCGVGRADRKTIWIQPFWRGPEAALIQTRPKVSS